MKEPLTKALWRLTERGFDGVIFGGTLRDLMVNGASTGPRDIDVVVDGASVGDLAQVFQDVLVRKNRFGGLHLNVSGWLVDVWPLSETWALKELPVAGKDFESLTRTTFLNVEAVTIDLAVRRGARQIHASGFFEAMKTKILDINLEENPFPELAAIRALITASKLRFSFSRRLALYVVRQAHTTPLERFVDIQMSHYGFVMFGTETIHDWIRAIQAQARTQSVITIPVKEPTQLPLWG
ncbi:MAG: hypothetical protein WAL84_16645, partial [Candidatus Dormiibacterota bacterium]